jgi:hypothetical protein
MIDYSAILTRKYPNTEWTINGDDYAGLTWLSDSAKPAKKDLDALWTSVEAEIKAEAQAKVDAKTALLERLGITETEAKILLG